MSLRAVAGLLALVVMAGPGNAQQGVDASQPEKELRSQTNAMGSQAAGGGREAFHRFVADSVGPYPIAMGLMTAGLHQATDNPPEWHQGVSGLSKRFASNMGVTATGNAVRYGVAWAMDVDPRFEKCHCKGFAPRLGHAVKSTAFARGEDGEQVISVPNLAASYAATSVAVAAWYPGRYNEKDAFRMGNFNLLGTLGTNIAFEFMPPKALEFLQRFHLGSSRVADTSQNP